LLDCTGCGISRHTTVACSCRVQVAEEIREVLNLYDQMYPTILEIPSKDHPYSAEKDYIMKRVMHMLGK
jgi:vacuolar-type H+-ATPase subunit F/Vma7